MPTNLSRLLVVLDMLKFELYLVRSEGGKQAEQGLGYRSLKISSGNTGGEIHLDSELGKGTEVKILIPISPRCSETNQG